MERCGLEEQEAIARLQRGDISGLEILVRLYHLQAIRAAYLVTRDRSLAEDIMQTAFLRAYERIGQFDAQRPFGPWFLKSVIRDAVKAASREKRYVSFQQSDLPESNGSTYSHSSWDGEPAALLERAETHAEIESALALLPPVQRAMIVQRYFLGLGEVEMASLNNCPPGTIKWRLHAARKRLRLLLRLTSA